MNGLAWLATLWLVAPQPGDRVDMESFQTRYVSSAASQGETTLISYWDLSGASMTGALAKFDFATREFEFLKCALAPDSRFFTVCAAAPGFVVINIEPKAPPQALILNEAGECRSVSMLAEWQGWPAGRRLTHAAGDGQRLWLTFAGEKQPHELALAKADVGSKRIELVHERALEEKRTGFWLPLGERLFFLKNETGVIEELDSNYKAAKIIRKGEPVIKIPDIRGLSTPDYWSLFMGITATGEGASMKVNTFLDETGSSLEQPLRMILGLARDGSIGPQEHWILGVDGPYALAHDPKSGAFTFLNRGSAP